MTARAAMREMTALTQDIPSGELPRRPNWLNTEDKSVLEKWHAYLQWEESNPLQFDDQTALQSRILFVYRRAFAEARFYPSVW